MRLAPLALVVLAAPALTGCHEILRVSLGEPDPPVHNPPPAGRTASASAAAGRAFTGRAEGSLTGRMVLKHDSVKSRIGNARFFGPFSAKLRGAPVAGDGQLGPLADAEWHGQFTVVRNRATGKVKMRGLLLATFTDATAGRACLRISSRGKRRQNTRPSKAGRARISVLGGEGDARTLAGTATARLKVAPDTGIRLRGTVKARRGAPRGFPPACAKLERKFGLAPLSV
jgi:hypothetical protein